VTAFFLEIPMTHHVILGAGPAGVIAAETIRKLAPLDAITLIGDEPSRRTHVWPFPTS
jgi:NADPH-dependent 2,4-dienoyl-CoA reductase/sulfur reductase-like enzyme